MPTWTVEHYSPESQTWHFHSDHSDQAKAEHAMNREIETGGDQNPQHWRATTPASPTVDNSPTYEQLRGLILHQPTEKARTILGQHQHTLRITRSNGQNCIIDQRIAANRINAAERNGIIVDVFGKG